MKLIALLLLALPHVVLSEYQIWNPAYLAEAFANRTRTFGEYIMERTSAVGDAIGEYVAEAQKTTVELGRSMSQNEGIAASNSKPEIKGCNVDAELSPLQIIAKYGYPAESHIVRTEDGYLLTMHRIPRGKRRDVFDYRQPVLLHHGLLTSSGDWILAGPDKSLAFALSDMGYDVWMANTRGNTHSRAHVSVSIKNETFWDFSWHDIAQYDLPAYIDFIERTTEKKGELLYIGHSMGTTVAFSLLSTRPEYNARIKAVFALAPVAYMSTIRSPIRYLAPFANDIEFLARLLGNGEFMPNGAFVRWLGKIACEMNDIEKELCENSLFVLCGFDRDQFNSSLMPVIFGHSPAGTSTKTMVHYAQEIKNKGRFQQFDYGECDNVKHYGTKSPPAYDLSKITTPVALFASHNDWLSSLVDVQRLHKELKNPTEMYVVPLQQFNHIDFLWGIDAPSLVYKPLVELMNNYRTKEMRFSHSRFPYRMKIL